MALNPKGLFIIGTDTGVGKTLIATLIIDFFQNKAAKISVMKPFESGEEGNADSKLLWQACQTKGAGVMPWQICPYRFAEPLAPAQAAARAGTKIDLKRVDQAFTDLQAQGFVIVEGCGGLLVPLLPEEPGFTVESLVLRFKLPVLIVARAGLGTLNHTLLTLKRCQAVKIPVIGVVLNNTVAPRDQRPDVSAELNRASLQALTETPIWGPLPYFANRSGKHPATVEFLEGLFAAIFT